MTSAIPVQRSNQLSQQANWELVIRLVLYKPVKGKDEMNIWISYLNCGKYELDRKKIIAVIDTTFCSCEKKKGKDERMNIFSFHNCKSSVYNCDDLLSI